MAYEDEIDDAEIDKEMGWATDLKKDQAKRKRQESFPGSELLKKIRLPHAIARPLKRALRGIFKIVFFPIISPLGYSKSFTIEGDMMVVKRSLAWRLLDALLTRLMLTPVILAIFLLAVVYATTHPARVQAASTPESQGLYFKRIRLVTVDAQGLGAWYIPPITADEMAFDPDASIAQRWPAAVLCHGMGATQEQYLPLAAQLHRAGFAVLMIDMRGLGESDAAAVTYGLREQLDVLAGVKYLRELPNIDGSKVCVVGHDIGAMAALQAASLDSSIAAVVVDGMWPKFEDRAHAIFSRPIGRDVPTGWLAPLYTVVFEVAVRDRLARLDPLPAVRNLHTQPVFFVARQGDEFAPVQDVMTLATLAGSHHETMVSGDATPRGEFEKRTTDFLMQATNWQGVHAKGINELQKLLDKRLK